MEIGVPMRREEELNNLLQKMADIEEKIDRLSQELNFDEEREAQIAGYKTQLRDLKKEARHVLFQG